MKGTWGSGNKYDLDRLPPDWRWILMFVAVALGGVLLGLWIGR